MKKNKSFLGLYLIISLVFVVVSVVLALTVGINFSSDIAGGTQIEVTMNDGILTSTYTNKIDDVLDKYGLNIDTNFVEDKYNASEKDGEFIRFHVGVLRDQAIAIVLSVQVQQMVFFAVNFTALVELTARYAHVFIFRFLGKRNQLLGGE